MRLIENILGIFKRKNDGRLLIEMGRSVATLQRNGFRMRGYGQSLRTERRGAVWRRENRRYDLMPQSEPNPHVVISGMSGFGKSTLFRSMLKNICNAGISCIVFDAHDEHEAIVGQLGGKVYDPRTSGINMLSLDGMRVSDRISEITALFKRIYGLGYIQTTKLSECLWYTYRRYGARDGNDALLEKQPKMSDLLFEVGIFIRNSKTASERNSLMHLRDKISNLNIAALGKNATSAQQLLRGLHSFPISGIKGREAQIIYIEVLLSRLYHLMKDAPKDGRIRQYIMIDEAQFLINSSDDSSSIITRFIEEGRKYGRAVVIVTHSSATLNRQIIANSSTFISFYAREPSEISFVSKVMSSGADTEYIIKDRVGRLGRNEALIMTANDRAARVIYTGDLYHKSPANMGAFARVPKVSRPVKIEALCAENGIAGADVARAVGLGDLDLFRFGEEEWVMSKRGDISIEHEVMVIKIHAILKGAGIGSYIFDRSSGPDIVAFYRGKRIAIEYETGHKDFEETSKMLRSRKEAYSMVIVVTPDHVRQKYEGGIDGLMVIEASKLHTIAGFIMRNQI